MELIYLLPKALEDFRKLGGRVLCSLTCTQGHSWLSDYTGRLTPARSCVCSRRDGVWENGTTDQLILSPGTTSLHMGIELRVSIAEPVRMLWEGDTISCHYKASNHNCSVWLMFLTVYG